jgi:hypothetical protein
MVIVKNHPRNKQPARLIHKVLQGKPSSGIGYNSPITNLRIVPTNPPIIRASRFIYVPPAIYAFCVALKTSIEADYLAIGSVIKTVVP